MHEPRPGRVLLFQYGSNMSPDRLNSPKRLSGQASPISAARLDGWGIRFDLYSKTNASAVTNIVPAPGEHVMGVVYEMPKTALAKMDEIEGVRPDGRGNYRRVNVQVTAVPDGDAVTAVTYIGTEAGRNRFSEQPLERQAVAPAYFDYLLAGAQQFSFSAQYIDYLRRQAGLSA